MEQQGTAHRTAQHSTAHQRQAQSSTMAQHGMASHSTGHRENCTAQHGTKQQRNARDTTEHKWSNQAQHPRLPN
eukprot:8657154-Alexandrium_andersonii.AAC.1